MLLAVLLTGIACAFLWRNQLTVSQIQAFVAGLGTWGPVVFLLLYAVGPTFLVPGLPLDLAAGILFGPVWGTVYSLVGATVGALGAGFVPPPKRFGWLIVGLCVWLGIGITGVGLVPSLVPAALLMGFSGISTGVVNTYAVSWLQRRTDSAMQGRVMSLVMLASMGLTPVAYAASGVVANVNPTLLFVIAGGMILVCAAAAAASRTVRSLR